METFSFRSEKTFSRRILDLSVCRAFLQEIVTFVVGFGFFVYSAQHKQETMKSAFKHDRAKRIN